MSIHDYLQNCCAYFEKDHRELGCGDRAAASVRAAAGSHTGAGVHWREFATACFRSATLTTKLDPRYQLKNKSRQRDQQNAYVCFWLRSWTLIDLSSPSSSQKSTEDVLERVPGG